MFVLGEDNTHIKLMDEFTVVTNDGVRHHGLYAGSTPEHIQINNPDYGLGRVDKALIPWENVYQFLPGKRELMAKEEEIRLVSDLFFAKGEETFDRVNEFQRNEWKKMLPHFRQKYIKGYKANVGIMISNTLAMDFFNVFCNHVFPFFSEIKTHQWRFSVLKDNDDYRLRIQFSAFDGIETIETLSNGMSFSYFVTQRPWLFEDHLRIGVDAHEIVPVLNEEGERVFGKLKFVSNMVEF